MFYVAIPMVSELGKKGLNPHHKTSHFFRPSQISQRFLQVSSFRQTWTRFFFFFFFLLLYPDSRGEKTPTEE